MKKLFHITIFFALIGLTLSACTLPVKVGDSANSPTLEPVHQITTREVQIHSVESQTISPSQVNIYRDENAGLALDYPATWRLENNSLQGAAESVIYTSSLFSWDRDSYTPTPKDLNTLPEGGTQVDITVFNQGPGTLSEAVNQFKNQDNGATVRFLNEEDWILNNGEKAVYIEAEGGFGIVATMITLVNTKVVYVSGYGNLTPFKAIALTLRANFNTR